MHRSYSRPSAADRKLIEASDLLAGIYNIGWRARAADAESAQCPFRAGTAAALAWRAGWTDCQKLQQLTRSPEEQRQHALLAAWLNEGRADRVRQ
jgi:hypothetical protein